jgi:hypothetical protein
MAKKRKDIKGGKTERRKRVKLSVKAALQHMRTFGNHREQFIAAIREGKD